MGKQITFYMGYDTEIKFFDYLVTQCRVSNKIENGNIVFTDTLPERFSDKEDWVHLILYKPEMGQCTIVTYGNGNGYVDVFSSPVIEFRRTIIHPDDKIITHGRLYVIMDYYDEKDNRVKKCNELNELYKDLCKWIRKHIPKHEYENPITLTYANRMGLEYGVSPGHLRKEYISESMLTLVKEEGYHTS